MTTDPTVSPAYAIVPSGGTQQYTLVSGPPSGATWEAIPSSAVSWSPTSPGLATVDAPPGTQVIIKATVGSGPSTATYTTMMTVAPEGALSDKVTLMASTNGTVYLLTELQESFLASPIMLANNGCPEYILAENEGVAPWGVGQPVTSYFPPPTSGLSYLSCVVVNLAASVVGEERKHKHPKK